MTPEGLRQLVERFEKAIYDDDDNGISWSEMGSNFSDNWPWFKDRLLELAATHLV